MTNPDKIQHWIRPAIRELRPYHVPDSGGLIKLDAMENPYRWPEDLHGEWLGMLADITVNRYPDPQARAVQQKLRAVMDIPPAMELMLGNGSDELIQIIALALNAPGRVLLAPEPTFSMYRMIALATGMDFVGVPLRDDFSLDGRAMLQAIEQHQPAAVFLAYPNNPTGNLFDRTQVDAIIKASPGLVVLDEAYHAFAGDSYMPQLGGADNVLVMRTLSKMGLAGLRLGLLAGPPAWLREFEKVRLPYNINVLTQASVAFALDHVAVFNEQTRAICAGRSHMLDELQRIDGVRPYPSHANFILFRVPAGRADTIFEGLKRAGILLKNLHHAGSALADCLRVTVGTPEENTRFLSVLRGMV